MALLAVFPEYAVDVIFAFKAGQDPTFAPYAAATLYSFNLPLKAVVAPIDSLVLIGIFVVYAVLVARSEAEEPHLVGPAAIIGGLPTVQRRLVILA